VSLNAAFAFTVCQTQPFVQQFSMINDTLGHPNGSRKRSMSGGGRSAELKALASRQNLSGLPLPKWEIMMKKLVLAVAAASGLALSGCATLMDSRPPLTIDQLVDRAKTGESVESLLASLRGSRERFALTGSDYAKLKERGLPEPVLDELQARELQAVREDEWMRSPQYLWNPWWRGWPYTGYHYVQPPRPIPRPKT
jgi:hypothetical protein